MRLVVLVLALLANWFAARVVFAQTPIRQVVTGTMWVVDKDVRRIPRDGIFHLCYDGDDGMDSVKVHLDSGAFRCELPLYAQNLSIGRIVIEDLEGWCTWQGSLATASTPLELEARLFPPSRVRVRIHDTRVELDRCVLSGVYAPTGRAMQSLPCDVTAWAEDCMHWYSAGWSPTDRVMAIADGYARAYVDVDRQIGGDFWIELGAEASLAVRVALPSGLAPQRLWVRGPDGGEGRLVEHDGIEFVFEHLVPGHYSIDTAGSTPGAWISQYSIELAPGEIRKLRVDLARESNAQLAITTILPPNLPALTLVVTGPDQEAGRRELTGNGQRFLFDGLRAGSYTIDARTRDGTRAKWPASTQVELKPGESRELRFDLSLWFCKKRLPVRGTLLLDPMWDTQAHSDILLTFERLDGAYIHANTSVLDVWAWRPDDRPYSGEFEWDAGLLRCGEYFIRVPNRLGSLEPLGWGTVVTIHDPEEPQEWFMERMLHEPFHLHVEAGVPCTVHLVDAGTREAIESGTIYWSWGLNQLPCCHDSSPANAIFMLNSPRGPVTIQGHADGYVQGKTEVPFPKEASAFTLALEPACRIRVRLKEGADEISFPEFISPSAALVDGTGHDFARAWTRTSVTLSVAQPGKYTISLPAIGGFQVPDAIIVEARKREIVEVVFQLIRS